MKTFTELNTISLDCAFLLSGHLKEKEYTNEQVNNMHDFAELLAIKLERA